MKNVLQSPYSDLESQPAVIGPDTELTKVGHLKVEHAQVLTPSADAVPVVRQAPVPYALRDDVEVEREEQAGMPLSTKIAIGILGISSLATAGWLICALTRNHPHPFPVVGRTGMRTCDNTTLADSIDNLSLATAYSNPNNTFANVFPAPYSGNEPFHLTDTYTDLVKRDNATWNALTGLMSSSEEQARSHGIEWLANTGVSGFTGQGQLVEFADVKKDFYGCRYTTNEDVSPSSPGYISPRAERLDLFVFNSSTPHDNHQALVNIEKRFMDEQRRTQFALDNGVKLSQNRNSLFSRMQAKYAAQPVEEVRADLDNTRIKLGRTA